MIDSQGFLFSFNITTPRPNAAMARFLDRLAQGDLTLDADLLTACENKDESWHPRENSCNSTSKQRGGK